VSTAEFLPATNAATATVRTARTPNATRAAVFIP